MSARKTVVRTTRSSADPAASTIPLRFSITRSVCALMSPATSSCVDGSRAICPETNRRPFARMACEYGPMAFGPRSVAITSFTLSLPEKWKRSRPKRGERSRANGAAITAAALANETVAARRVIPLGNDFVGLLVAHSAVDVGEDLRLAQPGIF